MPAGEIRADPGTLMTAYTALWQIFALPLRLQDVIDSHCPASTDRSMSTASRGVDTESFLG